MSSTIPGYKLERPQASDLVDLLAKILGQEQAQVAVKLGLREISRSEQPLEALSLAELLALSRALIRQRGVVAVLGRAFAIRVHSYELLNQPYSGDSP